jgi:hypothetical protein
VPDAGAGGLVEDEIPDVQLRAFPDPLVAIPPTKVELIE